LRAWQLLLLSLGAGPRSVPFGLTPKEAQKVALRAEQQPGGRLAELPGGDQAAPHRLFRGHRNPAAEEDAEENAVRGYDEPGDTTSIDCCMLGDAAI